MIKIFKGGGVVDGEGSSERCLKWGVGVIKGSFQKHLKTGRELRQELFVGGRGFEGRHHPCPLRITLAFTHALF